MHKPAPTSLSEDAAVLRSLLASFPQPIREAFLARPDCLRLKLSPVHVQRIAGAGDGRPHCRLWVDARIDLDAARSRIAAAVSAHGDAA